MWWYFLLCCGDGCVAMVRTIGVFDECDEDDSMRSHLGFQFRLTRESTTAECIYFFMCVCVFLWCVDDY